MRLKFVLLSLLSLLLLAVGFSASCFDHPEPGQILFDVEYSLGRSSGSVEIFCLGDDTQRSQLAAVVDEVVLRGRG